jgi:hypothetical protein
VTIVTARFTLKHLIKASIGNNVVLALLGTMTPSPESCGCHHYCAFFITIGIFFDSLILLSFALLAYFAE